MAFFQPPPPNPVVSATGAQPNAQGKSAAVIPLGAAAANDAGISAHSISGVSISGDDTEFPAGYPFRRLWHSGVIDAWQPGPPFPAQQRKLAPSLLAGVSFVPFSRRWIDGILAAWQPVYQTQFPNNKLTPPSVDNPPFSQEKQQQFNDVPWYYDVRLNKYVPVAAAQFQPYSEAWLSAVLQAWQPADHLQTQQRKLTPPSVDNPPFSQEKQQQFNDVPWWVVLPKLLSPGIPGQSVDSPPFTSREQQEYRDAPWQAVLRGLMSPGIPGQSVDNPPRFRFDLTGVLRSWQPSDPLPTLNIKLTPPSVDNPPPLTRQQIQFAVDALQPILPAKYPQAFVAQVTSQPYANPWIYIILAAWAAQDPIIIRQALLNPSLIAVPVNDPPFDRRRLENPFIGWLPPEPFPHQQRKLSPGIPGQSVDNPPTIVRQVFQTPDLPPPPQLPRYYPQEFVAQTTQPFNNLWLSTVISQWQADAGRIILPTKLTPPSVDNPPRFYRPQQFQSVEEVRRPILPVHLPQEFVSQAQPYIDAWLSTVLQAWVARDPDILRQLQLNPSLLAVAVNNPPFSSRDNLSGIVTAWQPPSWDFFLHQGPPNQIQPGPPPPPGPSERFTVSGPTIEDLFGPVGDVSWNWSGGTQKRTV